MTIAVDVDLLRQHRLGLLLEVDEIERLAGLDPPDVGALISVLGRAVAIDDREPPVLDMPLGGAGR